MQEQVREEQRADFFILGTADTVEGLEPGQVLTDQGVYEMEDAFVQQYLYTWVTARVMAVQGRQSSDAQNAEAEQSEAFMDVRGRGCCGWAERRWCGACCKCHPEIDGCCRKCR